MRFLVIMFWICAVAAASGQTEQSQGVAQRDPASEAVGQNQPHSTADDSSMFLATSDVTKEYRHDTAEADENEDNGGSGEQRSVEVEKGGEPESTGINATRNWEPIVAVLQIVASFGSVVAAGAAVLMSRHAIKSSQRTAKSQLRAYLQLESLGTPPGTPDTHLAVSAVFKNCGQTPAQIEFVERRVFAVIGQLVNEDADDLVREDYKIYLPPGASLEVGAANTMIGIVGFDELLRGGQAQNLARFRVHYHDVFGEAHVADFTRTVAAKVGIKPIWAYDARFPDRVD